MRLIDADALLLDNTWEWYDEYGNLTVAGRAVENAPTIDPVRHGYWKETDDPMFMACSVCGYLEYDCLVNNYCPECGTKMDGGE